MIKFKYKHQNFTICKYTLNILLKYLQVNNDREVGGMLIGAILKKSGVIEINDCTEPLYRDRRTRYTFKRSDYHNKLLNLKWRESNFTKMYLGEWHTHPQMIPVPSYQDKCSWRKILSKSITDSEFLIFVIVGTKTLEVWIGDRKKETIRKGGSYRYEYIQ